jgi:hypothetical protein
MRELVDPVTTDVPASAVSVLLAAENPYREGLVLINNSGDKLFVKWGSPASTDRQKSGYDFFVRPYRTYTEPDPAPEVALYGIWGGAAGGSVTVIEQVSRKKGTGGGGGGPTTLSALLLGGNDAGGRKITGLGAPASANDAATKAYVDANAGAAPATPSLAEVLAVGASAGNKKITALADPASAQDAATKAYVDSKALGGGTVAGDGSPNAHAEALGLVAWTFHPSLATFAGTQANTHLGSVWLKKDTVVTYLAVPVTIAGSGGTVGQLGIYDKNLNLVASTANSPAAFASTGWRELALTAPYVVPADGLYYLASGFYGGTLPTVLNVQQNGGIIGQPLPGGARLGVHADVPVSGLPNPAPSVATYSNCPLIVAR